jgi:NAD-dependent DNA ligase
MIFIDKLKLNQLVPYYMMTSYLYYVADPTIESPMTDLEYDALCKRLLENWNVIEHPHKYLINYDSLTAGTGFYLKLKDYPRMVVGAALQWAEENE